MKLGQILHLNGKLLLLSQFPFSKALLQFKTNIQQSQKTVSCHICGQVLESQTVGSTIEKHIGEHLYCYDAFLVQKNDKRFSIETV